MSALDNERAQASDRNHQMVHIKSFSREGRLRLPLKTQEDASNEGDRVRKSLALSRCSESVPVLDTSAMQTLETIPKKISLSKIRLRGSQHSLVSKEAAREAVCRSSRQLLKIKIISSAAKIS